MTSHPTTLSIPSTSLTLYPSLPPCCSAGLGLLRLPAGPVQLVPGCISWLIARHVFLPLRHWFRLQSPVVPDMLTSLEVMSETSPSLPDPLQVEDAENVLAKRDLSPNSCNEGHALPDELLRDVNHPDHSPSVLFIRSTSPTLSTGRPCISPCLSQIRFGKGNETFIWRGAPRHSPGFGSLGIGGGSPLLAS